MPPATGPCHVVFVRAANVGGRNVFRPAELARSLAPLEVVNIGAAGTFVVRGAGAAAVRRAILARLPFPLELAIVPAKDLLALVDSRPFRGLSRSKAQRGFAAVLTAAPKQRPRLPIAAPPGRGWSVRFERLSGRFALGLWRRGPAGFVFPSHVVEKAVGVPATTRWWETIERAAALARGKQGARAAAGG